MSTPKHFDLVVIGGGINGVAIARDAAGRGLQVALCERGDLGGATSSASSKLAHGGLRYLEHFEFALVRESLIERERLLANAPHLVRPLRFLLPLARGSRPAWFLHIGLWLYDFLGGGKLARSGRFRATADSGWAGVFGPAVRHILHYHDAWADDARLVIANALDAARRGATICPRHELVAARRENGKWVLTLRAGEASVIWTCDVLVNAGGPWAALIAERCRDAGAAPAAGSARVLRPVLGSHIVVPRCVPDSAAALLQNDDGRVVFLLPFHERFTLIGTTEVDVDSPEAATVSADEVAYLCRAVSRYLARPVTPADVVWQFAGVRPLFDAGDGAPSTALSREYELRLDLAGGTLPRLDVLGGKLTTHRTLAEAVLSRLFPYLPPLAPQWTPNAPLPGGERPPLSVRAELTAQHPDWSPAVLARLVGRYGTAAAEVIAACERAEGGREPWSPELLGGEVDYLAQHEWAQTADDILWRRTKAGVGLTVLERNALSARIAARLAVLRELAGK